MEDSLSIPANESVFCKSCYEKVNEADAFCDSCGYPLKGTETEQQNFITHRSVKELDLADYNNQIKKAGTALYWIAGILVFGGVLFYFTNSEDEDKLTLLIVNLVIAMIFVALGGWSQKKPLAAIISGASLYGIMVILNAIDNPLTIVRGIIFKIAVIAALIKGIKSALEAEKVKKELNIE